MGWSFSDAVPMVPGRPEVSSEAGSLAAMCPALNLHRLSHIGTCLHAMIVNKICVVLDFNHLCEEFFITLIDEDEFKLAPRGRDNSGLSSEIVCKAELADITQNASRFFEMKSASHCILTDQWEGDSGNVPHAAGPSDDVSSSLWITVTIVKVTNIL